MPPSPEEERHLAGSEFGGRGRSEDPADEKRRPPLYNAEDYASSLREWTRRGAWEAVCGGGAGGAAAESAETKAEEEQGSKGTRSGEMEMSCGGGREMSLREFSSVTHLLGTLAQDLQFALPSFVQEFVGDPLDGATLLLELLRVIQQSRRRAPPTPAPSLQRPLHAVASARASTASSTTSSIASSSAAVPPRYGRRRPSASSATRNLCAASLGGGGVGGLHHPGGLAQDERTCLECLRCCVRRAPDASWRLAESRAGLQTVAIAIMSASTQTRVAALEVLAKVCELGSRKRAVVSSSAYRSVSEALSSTRLSLGEPARFHFLVSMMSSMSGAPDLTPAALRFVNAFLEASPGPQERVFVQAELQHAGFSPDGILAVMPQIGAVADEVRTELRRWQDGFLNVDALPERLETAEKERVALREKVALLERKVQILQEEKGVLQSLERCLKERCCHLEDEVNGLRSGEDRTTNPRGDVGASSPVKGSVAGMLAGGGGGGGGSDSVDTKHHASTPEDEGISSTDNPSSSCSAGEEDEDAEMRQRSRRGNEEAERIVYETFAVQSETLVETRQGRKATQGREEEEETTIDEVIRELRDLVDDEEAARKEAESAVRAVRDKARRPGEVPSSRGDPPRAGRPSGQKVEARSPSARGPSAWGECVWAEEPEIVPSRILPQPPRRPRSLARQAVKNAASSAPFFEDESSGQSSDSEDQRPSNAAPVVQARTVVSGYSRVYGGLRRWETVVAGPTEGMAQKTTVGNQLQKQQQSPQQQAHQSPLPKILRRSESLHHGQMAALPEIWSKRAAEAKACRHDSRRGSLDDGLFFVAEAPTANLSPSSTPRPTPPPPPRLSPPKHLPFAARARKSRSLDRMDDEEGSAGGDWSLGWDFPRGRPPLSRSATRRANPPPSLIRRGETTDRSPQQQSKQQQPTHHRHQQQQQRCPPDGASSTGASYNPHALYGSKGQPGIYGIIGATEDVSRTTHELRKQIRGNPKHYPTRFPPQTAAKVTDLLSGLY